MAPDEEIIGPDEAAMTLENAILQLVVQLGGSKARYSKRQRQAKQAITQVYSPPRVTEWATRLPGYGMVIGFALDLTTRDQAGVPWDFDLPERREAARRRIVEKNITSVTKGKGKLMES